VTAKASRWSRQVREHPLFQQPLSPSYLSRTTGSLFLIDFLKYLFSFILCQISLHLSYILTAFELDEDLWLRPLPPPIRFVEIEIPPVVMML
jgi:hypothetical protein